MIRNQTNPIIIRPRISPLVVATMIAAGLVVVGVLLLAAYLYGKTQYADYLDQTQGSLDELNRRYTDLQQRHVGAQDLLAQVQRQLQMDKAAYTELRKELQLSSDELSELRNELKFYQSIISPDSGGAEGVRVENFSVAPGIVAGRFDYKLVLVQPLKDGKDIEGVLSFEIKGKDNGRATVFQFPPDSDRVEIKFKFFQSVKGVMNLPAGFKPEEIRVSLTTGGKDALNNRGWYPWSEVAAAG